MPNSFSHSIFLHSWIFLCTRLWWSTNLLGLPLIRKFILLCWWLLMFTPWSFRLSSLRFCPFIGNKLKPFSEVLGLTLSSQCRESRTNSPSRPSFSESGLYYTQLSSCMQSSPEITSMKTSTKTSFTSEDRGFQHFCLSGSIYRKSWTQDSFHLLWPGTKVWSVTKWTRER